MLVFPACFSTFYLFVHLNTEAKVLHATLGSDRDLPWAQDVLVQKDGRSHVDFTKFHDSVPIQQRHATGALTHPAGSCHCVPDCSTGKLNFLLPAHATYELAILHFLVTVSI